MLILSMTTLRVNAKQINLSPKQCLNQKVACRCYKPADLKVIANGLADLDLCNDIKNEQKRAIYKEKIIKKPKTEIWGNIILASFIGFVIGVTAEKNR